MLLRFGSLMVVVLVAGVASPSVQAQTFQFPNRPFGLGASTIGQNATSEFHQTADRIKLDYNRNAAWPTPFVEMDRASYRDWFQPCIDRGWELELTLSDACFDNKGQLNRMGAAKIQQIVRHSPESRRTVFVYAGSEEASQSRIQEVETFVREEYGRSANLLVASTSNFPVPGRGNYAEKITRNFSENLPTPVLNAQAVSGAVSGSGGGQ